MRLNETKISAIACALVFLICFSFYLSTLNPVFRADDSPETITSCVHLGIQHPPGYPLHTLVGNLFASVPIASPAFRINLMAAFFGALSSALLCLVLFLLFTRYPGIRNLACDDNSSPLKQSHLPALLSLCGGLLIGLSSTFWSQSLAAKGGIYTFHAFFLILLFYCLIKWDLNLKARRRRFQSSRLRMLGSPWFLMTCLVLGLGTGNHWETQILFLFPAALFALLLLRDCKIDPKLSKGKNLYRPLYFGFALLLAGFSIYLVLPIRASFHPATNWGAPTTLDRFLWVFFRAQYLDLEVGFLKALLAFLTGQGSWSSVAETWPFVAAQGKRVLSHLVSPQADLGLVAVPFFLLGIFSLFESKVWRPLVFWGSLCVFFISVITFYFHLKPEMIWILDVFLIPVYMGQAFFAAIGIAWTLNLLTKALRNSRPYLGVASVLILAIGLNIFTVISARSLAPKVTQRNQFWAYDFGRDFLDSLPRNAVVFAEGDFNTMPIYYIQNVENRRRDVAHLTTIFLSIDWGVEELKYKFPELNVTAIPKPRKNTRQGDGALLKEVVSQIMQQHYPRRPIHVSLFRSVFSANLTELSNNFLPSGLSAQFQHQMPARLPKRSIGLLKSQRSRWLSQDRFKLEPSPAFALSNYASTYMDLGTRLRAEGRHAEAMPLFETAARVATKPNLSQAYTHLGIGYSGLKQLDKAVQAFRNSVKAKPIFEAWANLAGTLNQLKKYDEAEEASYEALKLNPNSPQSWNNLAIAQYYQGKKATAIASLEKAVELNPTDPGIRKNLQALRGSK